MCFRVLFFIISGCEKIKHINAVGYYNVLLGHKAHASKRIAIDGDAASNPTKSFLQNDCTLPWATKRSRVSFKTTLSVNKCSLARRRPETNKRRLNDAW